LYSRSQLCLFKPRERECLRGQGSGGGDSTAPPGHLESSRASGRRGSASRSGFQFRAHRAHVFTHLRRHRQADPALRADGGLVADPSLLELKSRVPMVSVHRGACRFTGPEFHQAGEAGRHRGAIRVVLARADTVAYSLAQSTATRTFFTTRAGCMPSGRAPHFGHERDVPLGLLGIIRGSGALC
jgi:hypothetical protein